MKNIAKILCFVLSLVLVFTLIGVSTFADSATVVKSEAALRSALTTGGNTEFLNQLSQRIEAVTASIYTRTIAIAQETGEVRKDINPAFFAFLLDNVFMMLQFSTACPYYKERFFIYTGKQVEDGDELIVEQTLLFLKAAFNFK